MDTFDTVVEFAEFSPTEAMIRCKSHFWARVEELPMIDPTTANLAQAIQFTGNTSLSKWWKIPGFTDFFLNKYEWRTQIEFLAMLSLQTAERILRNEHPAAASAQVSLIGKINELANKMPAKNKEVRVLDSHISKLTEDELSEYIRKNSQLLEPANDEVVSMEKHRAKSKKSKSKTERVTNDKASDDSEDSGAPEQEVQCKD